MNYIIKTARKYKGLIIIFIVLGMMQAFLQSLGSYYYQIVINSFTDGTLTVRNILIYGVLLIALYIASYLDEYPGRKLEHGITLSLKTAALRKIARIDYLAYIKCGTGTLIQRIENGASAGSNILFGFYITLAHELLPQMVFSVLFIFAINRSVTIALLLGYIFVFIITNLLLQALYKVKAGILVNEEKLNHFLVRGFMEMVVFRVNRRFADEIKKAEAASDEIVSSKTKLALIHEAFFAIFAILVTFIKIGIIIYGWTANALNIGEIVSIISLVENAYTPIAIFNVLYVQYKLDTVAFARYTEFLDTDDDIRLSQGVMIPQIEGNISFSNVGFNYGGREIFSDLNINIGCGKTVAFVGDSGSGKSTAVKLLVGLIHPHCGHVAVDSFDLEEVNLNSYYEHIAYLPQEPPIFDGTLRENLVFDDLIDDAALITAIKNVGLDGLLSKLEKGLDTPLGEKGVSLSGGERQQLALARLYFSNAEIIVLDEATSAIDNLTEHAVMKNILSMLSGRTVIAIAHRLDSIKFFDNIIVFRDGQIEESGTFEDLISNRRHFYELYNRSLKQE